MSHLELLRVNPVDPNIFHPGFGFLKFLLQQKPVEFEGVLGPSYASHDSPPQRLPEVASDSYLEMALHDAWPRSNMVEKTPAEIQGRYPNKLPTF